MRPDVPSCAQIGFGRVMHVRQQPVTHRFDYPVYFVRLPLHDLAQSETRWFSRNRFNLLSFNDADHGDGGDCLAWARGLLRQHGLAADGEIWLTTFPRVLGYGFHEDGLASALRVARQLDAEIPWQGLVHAA